MCAERKAPVRLCPPHLCFWLPFSYPGRWSSLHSSVCSSQFSGPAPHLRLCSAPSCPACLCSGPSRPPSWVQTDPVPVPLLIHSQLLSQPGQQICSSPPHLSVSSLLLPAIHGLFLGWYGQAWAPRPPAASPPLSAPFVSPHTLPWSGHLLPSAFLPIFSTTCRWTGSEVPWSLGLQHTQTEGICLWK